MRTWCTDLCRLGVLTYGDLWGLDVLTYADLLGLGECRFGVLTYADLVYGLMGTWCTDL